MEIFLRPFSHAVIDLNTNVILHQTFGSYPSNRTFRISSASSYAAGARERARITATTQLSFIVAPGIYGFAKRKLATRIFSLRYENYIRKRRSSRGLQHPRTTHCLIPTNQTFLVRFIKPLSLVYFALFDASFPIYLHVCNPNVHALVHRAV